jgi:opacity protein-like surface antigen
MKKGYRVPGARFAFWGFLIMTCMVAWGQIGPAEGGSNGATALRLERTPPGIWQNGVGEGFRSTTESVGVSAGALYGLEIFGGTQAHDLAFVNFSYGHMLGPVRGEGHWYRGNWELRGELFTGAQFAPESEWFVGLTPHLRYSFATGTRWIPFIDGGAGVTATGIGPPDLSGTFEFNLQVGGGVQWFLNDHLALSVEARYTHWSCAGIHDPNLGLNGVTGLLGLSWFF